MSKREIDIKDLKLIPTEELDEDDDEDYPFQSIIENSVKEVEKFFEGLWNKLVKTLFG